MKRYSYSPWLRTPIVSSKVIALMFKEARMASLSASVGSSFEGTWRQRLLRQSVLMYELVTTHLGREYHTHITQIDIHSSQVRPAQW